tara:strand:- start:1080 stop:1751 length:672 start_codon:yes stop_codon:yes gene_type:complete
MLNVKNEFKSYATKHLGVSSLALHDYESSMTPFILEEREMRVTQMDIFSRLMMERIIWCAGPINDGMSTIVQAQLMFLDNLDSKSDIVMHIDSPGGSVKSGLSIIDVMNYVKCDIATINTGMAASMGAVLLGAGAKGKRASLRFSRSMIHQSSGGSIGNIQDARIDFMEWEKINKTLFELLGEYCDKDAEQVMKDAERDNWMTADESLKYGLIDEVIGSKKKK